MEEIRSNGEVLKAWEMYIIFRRNNGTGEEF